MVTVSVFVETAVVASQALICKARDSSGVYCMHGSGKPLTNEFKEVLQSNFLSVRGLRNIHRYRSAWQAHQTSTYRVALPDSKGIDFNRILLLR